MHGWQAKVRDAALSLLFASADRIRGAPATSARRQILAPALTPQRMPRKRRRAPPLGLAP